jgi:hypothetical protein
MNPQDMLLGYIQNYHLIEVGLETPLGYYQNYPF